jgi:hypothetical protein
VYCLATGCLAAEREATAAAENAAVTEYHAIHIVSPTGFDSGTAQTPALYAWLRSRRSLIEKALAKAGDFIHVLTSSRTWRSIPPIPTPFSWAVVRSTSTPIAASRRYAWPHSLP